MNVCVISDCERSDIQGRGLCNLHYKRARRSGRLSLYPLRPAQPFVNPMVCECPEPVTDRLGECATCRRKPLALMAVKS